MLKLLEEHLNNIDSIVYDKNQPRGDGTKLITAHIEKFANENHFKLELEVFIGLRRKTNDYRGLVDIIITRPDNTKYAIEIDSSNKKWSLEKLIYANSIGYIPIWIRWRTKIKIETPSNINLIDLTKRK